MEVWDGVGEVDEVSDGRSVVWIRVGSVDSEVILETGNGCV